MRMIPTLLAVVIAVGVLPAAGRSADGASVQALLISASNQKGENDRRLSAYESTLRRNLPFDTFRLTAEGAATVRAGARTRLNLGRGHHLELEAEPGRGPGIRLKVDWMSGSRTVMSTSLTLQPGVPAVLGRRGGDDREVPVILLIVR